MNGTGCSPTSRWLRRATRGALSLLVVIGLAAPVAAVPLTVRLDTTALAGTPAVLAFDLINGDGVANNTATILGFTTDGTLGVVGPNTGGTAGSLPGVVTLSDTAFFNEFLQSIVLGTSLRFVLDQTTSRAAGSPDSFTVFLLNAMATASLVTTNLLGDALLEVDSVGPPGGLAISVAATTAPPITVTATVPGPAALVTVLMGLPLLVTTLRRGRRVRSAERARRSVAPAFADAATDRGARRRVTDGVVDRRCDVCGSEIAFQQLFSLGERGRVHLACHFTADRREPRSRHSGAA